MFFSLSQPCFAVAAPSGLSCSMPLDMLLSCKWNGRRLNELQVHNCLCRRYGAQPLLNTNSHVQYLQKMNFLRQFLPQTFTASHFHCCCCLSIKAQTTINLLQYCESPSKDLKPILLLCTFFLFEEKELVFYQSSVFYELPGFFFSSRAEPHSAGVLHGQTQRAILHQHSLKVYLSVERKKTTKKKMFSKRISVCSK